MLLTSSDDIARLTKVMSKEDEVVFDLETNGLYCWRGNRTLSLSVYLPKDKSSHTVLVNKGDNLFSAEALPRPLLKKVIRAMNDVPILIAHNAKFDLSFLDNEGLPIRHGRSFEPEDIKKLIWDTQHAVFLISNLAESKALKTLTSDVDEDSPEWLEYAPAGLDLEESREVASKHRANLQAIEPERMANYAEIDCVLTYILYKRELAAEYPGLWGFMYREMQLLLATMDMEKYGIGFNWSVHRQLMSDMATDLAKIRAQIPFDPMSGNALLHNLGTEDYKKETFIDQFGEEDPLVNNIIAYREQQHDYSTFGVKYAKMVSDDGVMHPNLRQNGTVTGRYTSNNPNILGFPKRMRSQWIPQREGYEFISCDLSGIELVMCAWYADCEILTNAVLYGDVHQQTADMIGSDRDTAKRVNFSMVYGIGTSSLAQRLHVSEAQAAVYMKKFKKAYSELTVAKARCEAATRRNGYVRLFNGHQRQVPEVRKAWSFLIQSAVAELAKDILINLHGYSNETGYPLVLHVHDEFMLEIPIGDEKARKEVVDIIEGSGPSGFKYKTDCKLWGAREDK